MYVPNQRINLDGVHIVQLLQRRLDLPLVGLDVNDEDERVVLLNLLHRALRVERVQDHLVSVEARLMRDRLARVLGRPRQLQSLGAVERCRPADLANFVRLNQKKNILRQHRRSVGDFNRISRTLTPLRTALAAALACFEGLVTARLVSPCFFPS